MKHFKSLIKSLLIVALSIMLAFTTLIINPNKVSAASFDSTDFYREPEAGYSNSISVVTGLGRTRGTASSTAEFFQNGKTIAGNNYGGYAICGSFNSPAEASKKSSSVENRYQQTGTSTNKTNSVDIYYGDYVLKGVTSSAIYFNSTTKELFTSSATGRKQLCALGFTNTFNVRFVYVEADLVVVEHYSANERTLTVSNVANTSFASSLDEYYDKYYTTKDTTNNVMSTIVSNNYSNTNGLVQDFELLSENEPNSASVTIGNNAASTSGASGIYYLSSSYVFSNEHASNDILAIDFDNEQIIYYTINNNINILFNYATNINHDVTFMVDGVQYGEVVSVGDGYTVARPLDPEIPEGYDIFVGWYNGNTLFNFNTPVNSDLTLEAVFEVEHKVSFINFGHEYVSAAGSLLNAYFLSSGSWAGATGGSLDAHNCVGTAIGDYESSSGLAINGYTILSDLDHLVLTFGDREPLTLKLSDVRGTSYFVNADYELEDRTATGPYVTGDIFKIAVGSGATNTINMRFYKIVEDVKIECVYNTVHTITIENFGNASHDYVGTGKFKASGAEYNFYTWDPYGASSGGNVNLRNGGTIDYHAGIATIYGDYSSTDGYGAALLIHDDFSVHSKVIFTYNNRTVSYPLILDEGTNETWYINDVKILQYVHVKDAEYYNVRFYNVAGDINIKSSNEIDDPSTNGHHIYFDGAGDANGGSAITSTTWATVTEGNLDPTGVLITNDDFESLEGVPVRVNTSIGKLKQVTFVTLEDEYVINKNDFTNNVDQQLGDYARLVRETGDKYFDIYFYKVVDDININIEYDDVTMTYNDVYSSSKSISFNAYPDGTALSALDASFTVNSSLLKNTNDDSIQIGIVPDNAKMDGVVVSDGINEYLFSVNQTSATDYTFGKLKFAKSNGNYFIRFYYLNTDISVYPHTIDTINASQKLVLNADGTTSLNILLTLSPSADSEDGFLRINDEDIPFASLRRKIDGKDNIVYTYRIENISPKNMGDSFNIQFFKNQDESYNEQHTLSVKNYLTTIINGEYATSLKNFAKSMLNYGGYLQNYFKHDEDNLVNEGLDIDLDSVEIDENNNPELAGTTEGISAYAQSLLLKYYTDFRVYFTLHDGYLIDQFTFTDNGEEVPVTFYSGNLYYVQVSRLAAPDLAVRHNIEVKYNGVGSLAVETSALAYANMIINDPNEDPALINAMKATYSYYNDAVGLKTNYGHVSSLDDVVPYDGEKVKVAFIGDSITAGYLASDASLYSYPAQLSGLFSDRYEIGNYGVSASYAIAADSPYNYRAEMPDKSYTNTMRYLPSRNFEPDVVVIMLGTNDIRSFLTYGDNAINAYKESMTALIETYQELPSVSKIYIATAIVSKNSTIGPYSDGQLQAIQMQLANELGLEVIDIYSATRDTFYNQSASYLSSDNLHPNDDGYLLIAQAFYDYFVNE